jgi:hypothetical protein
MPPREKSPHQLLVEGDHDKFVVINLLMRHGLDWDQPKTSAPHVRDCNSYQEVLLELPEIIRNSLYSRIGVLLDADTDLPKRWKEIQAAVGNEFVIGSKPEIAGLIASNSKRQKLGIWLMPDNSIEGALEDFIIKLVPENDSTWSHAEASVITAKNLGAPFTDGDRLKARLHTWLAWRKEPGGSVWASDQFQVF